VDEERTLQQQHSTYLLDLRSENKG